jgi:hypothetical protein
MGYTQGKPSPRRRGVYPQSRVKPLPQPAQLKHPVVHKAAAELSVRMLVLLKRKGWRIVEDPGKEPEAP